MTRDDGYTRYTVRIPTPLYERVRRAAGEKSVNAEIVATLEEAYPPEDTTLDDVIRAVLADGITRETTLGGSPVLAEFRDGGLRITFKYPLGADEPPAGSAQN